MNKYKLIFDIRKNKILFVFEHCKHDDNKISTSENLSFLSIISFIIIIRSLKFIIKNESNESNFDMNFSKNINKRLTSTFRIFKKNQKNPIFSILLKLTF